MSFRHLILSLIVLSLTHPVDAAEKSVRRLTWDEAVNLAQTQNPLLKQNRETLNASDYRLKASRWQLAPTLSADLSWARLGRSNQDLNESDSTALSLKQSIFDAANYGAIGEARATRRYTETTFVVARAQVSRDLKIALANAVFAQRSLKLTESIYQRRKQNYELVQLRFESGRENGGALQLSEANMADAKFSLVQAQNDADVANTQIAALLDLPVGEKVEIVGEIPLIAPQTALDYKSLAERAPERVQALANEERAKSAITTARGRILPTVSLTGAVGRYGDRFIPPTDGWSAGVTVSIPLFTGTSYMNVQAAKADAAAAEYQRHVTENNLVTRVQQAHVDYTEAEQRLQIAQTFVGAARTRAEVARQKYQTGLTTFDEWDRIESDLITRETSALQATLTRVTAEANWQYILGEGSLR